MGCSLAFLSIIARGRLAVQISSLERLFLGRVTIPFRTHSIYKAPSVASATPAVSQQQSQLLASHSRPFSSSLSILAQLLAAPHCHHLPPPTAHEPRVVFTSNSNFVHQSSSSSNLWHLFTTTHTRSACLLTSATSSVEARPPSPPATQDPTPPPRLITRPHPPRAPQRAQALRARGPTATPRNPIRPRLCATPLARTPERRMDTAGPPRHPTMATAALPSPALTPLGARASKRQTPVSSGPPSPVGVCSPDIRCANA